MESREQAEEVAARWIARRHGGEWGESDDTALQAWLQEDLSHRVAYLRLNANWQKAGRLNAFAGSSSSEAVPSPEQLFSSPYFERERRPQETGVAKKEGAPAPRRWFGRAPGAVAASILLAAVAGAAYFAARGPSYTTEIGGLRAVPMSDGSKITLNTDSRIRVALSGTERRVELERGEAFFEVAKDPTRPFVVDSGDERVVVVGTKFSVRRTGSHVRVVVTEGEVRVEPKEASVNAAPAISVRAGRVATGDEGATLLQNTSVDVDQLLSWRQGYLVFRETSLADVVAEFNRYNAEQIVIEDSTVAALRVDGNFRSTNVAVFLQLLEDGFPVSVARRGDHVVLKSSTGGGRAIPR